ncbi:MAG: energy-coupling factor transporter ATPase [Bacillota bacterium]
MLIEVKNVTHVYEQDQQVMALDDVNLSVEKGEFIGLVGHTGSGKSTLVQLFNGLIKPTQGNVFVENRNISGSDVSLKEIRQKIGLVFQYPEHQLFEESVYEDVAFGPRNLGLKKEQVAERVRESLSLVGLDFENIRDRSPFNLSGGQQRRVAIAGVLAMNPRVLILDEPSAGLDPVGREKLLALLRHLHRDHEMTIILISHRMEEIAMLATRVVVMNEGQIVLNDSPEEVYRHREKLQDLGLDLPEVAEILYRLSGRGLEVRTDIFSISGAAAEIIRGLRRREHNVN